MTSLLGDLLRESSEADLAELRSTRLRALGKKRTERLDATLEILDGLIRTISLRQEALESGDPDALAALPPPPPGTAELLPLVAEVSDLAITALDDTQDVPLLDGDGEAVPDAGAAVSPGVPAHATEIPLGQVSPGWTLSAELLFDDALRLFRLGDSDGALISLERLLATAVLNEDLKDFIDANEAKLLDVYHAIIGPWEKIPSLVRNGDPMPNGFFTSPKLGEVLPLVDGKVSMSAILEQAALTRLETLAVLSQLLRTKTIRTEAPSP